MEDLMTDECDCGCVDLESAASSAHLHCLKKHWNLRSSSIEAELGQLLLQKVTEHKHQPSQNNIEQRKDARACSGCLSFLLEAGAEVSTDAQWTPTHRHLNVLSICGSWLYFMSQGDSEEVTVAAIDPACVIKTSCG
jgi:hypothetical protein